MSTNSALSGKAIAIISYFWIVGWVIALIFHYNNRTSLGAFHLRQSLGVLLLAVANWILAVVFGLADVPLLGWLFSLGLFILWILGFLAALQETERHIPLFGEAFQRWFKEVITDA